MLSEVNATSSISEYLTTLYENTDGFVYLATKDPETADWQKHYFHWPEQRNLVEEFIVTHGQRTNVYIAPALFKDSSSSKKRNVKGSHVYWAEFDGAVPSPETLARHGIPEPSMRIRSSSEGREHWYWRCTEFNTDTSNIDGVNRGITYALGADPSGWDADQVLRPPATINFKHNIRVDFIGASDSRITLSQLEELSAEHKVDTNEFEETDVTPLQYIIGRYEFSKYELDRMAPTQKGDKSDRIYEIAMFCAEKSMTDQEIFSVLYWADKKVGKFTDRSDKIRQYNNLVSRARAKYPIEEAIPTGLSLRSFDDILNDPVEVEWQIEGLLQRSGLMILAGEPGIGKSQLSMQFLMAAARGQSSYLGFPIQTGRKGLFISLEMPTVELKSLFRTMKNGMPTDEQVLLNENLSWIDRGESLNFRDERVRKLIEETISINNIELMVVDSLSKMGIQKMQDEERIIEMMEWFDAVRKRYNCSLWIIHHNRKSSGERKADTMDDVYGSRFITAGATSVVVMARSKGKDNIKLKFEKIRAAPERHPLLITRKTHNLSFITNGMESLYEHTETLEEETANIEVTEPDETPPVETPLGTNDLEL